MFEGRALVLVVWSVVLRLVPCEPVIASGDEILMPPPSFGIAYQRDNLCQSNIQSADPTGWTG